MEILLCVFLGCCYVVLGSWVLSVIDGNKVGFHACVPLEWMDSILFVWALACWPLTALIFWLCKAYPLDDEKF
jgi:hypothetical protein